MEGKYHLLSYKKQLKYFWVWKYPAVKASANTRGDIEHCDHWEKIRTIILSYLSGAFPDKVN